MGLFKNEVGRPSNETIKKRNIFKGVCFILVLIIIGLVVLLLNEKGFISINNGKQENNSNKVENDKIIEKNQTIESKLLIKTNENYDVDTSEETEFNLNDTEYNIKLEWSSNKSKIYLQGKKIYETNYMIQVIYNIDNLLMFDEFGTDIIDNKITFIDFDGNLVKQIDKIDIGSLVFRVITDEDNLVVENGNITFKGSALYHGPSLMFRKTDKHKNLDKEKYKIFNIADGILGKEFPINDEVKKLISVKDDDIVMCDFKISYLGNNKFSEMSKFNKITYKDYMEEYNSKNN